jgi:hypothetical protein
MDAVVGLLLAAPAVAAGLLGSASDTKKAVLARHVRTEADPAPTRTPACRRRGASQALRALGNRLVGILHGCLTHHVAYDEMTAWAYRPKNELTLAA